MAANPFDYFRPFRFGPSVPTHEEVAGVSSIVGAEEWGCERDQYAEQVKELVEWTTAMDSSSNEDIRARRDGFYWADLDDTTHGRTNRRNAYDDCEMLLTRYERRRLAEVQMEPLAGVVDPDALEDEDDSSDKENQEHVVTHSPPVASDGQRPAKRPRLQHGNDSWRPQDIDDSGISFRSDAMAWDGYILDPAADNLDGMNPEEEGVVPTLAEESSPDEEYRVEFARYTIDRSYDGSGETTDWHVGFEDHPGSVCDDGHGHDVERREFLPLSFDSLQAPSQAAQPVYSQGILPAAIVVDAPDFILGDASVEPSLDARSMISTPPLVGIAGFMKLRLKHGAVPEPCSEPTSTQTPPETPPSHAADPSQLHDVPSDLFGPHTIPIPCPWAHPSTPHYYMASVDLIQKQAFVRALTSPLCAVGLAERDTLSGVDLILDPHSAIIFISLAVLPSQCASLTARLSRLSWRYLRVLVVFEAFPGSQMYVQSSVRAGATVYPFSPPILRAVGKLRRDLGIAEACGERYAAGSVLFAFARSVNEAAILARVFGDLAEECDETRGALWGGREWLEDEALEVGMGLGSCCAFG
jgi:hypothetical protein